MKRNIAIAAVTAALLVGGGAAATVAFADDDSSGTSRTQAAQDRDDRDDDGRDRDGKDDDGKDDDSRNSARDGSRITVDRAVAAALKAVPGTVTEAELEDDDDRDVWELDVYGSDKVWHDVTVDARNGKVLTDRDDDDNDDRDRHAPRSAAVSLNTAVDNALKSAPGSVTSVDLDDDDDDDGRKGGAPHWDVDVEGKDGASRELHVDAKTGKVTVDRDTDDDDNGDDDSHDD